MAIGLSATALPDEASVRLRLDSVVGYDTVLRDYSVATADANAAEAEAAAWAPTGSGVTVSGQEGRLVVSATAGLTGAKWVTYHFANLTVGQRYTINVWVDALANGVEVRLSRGATGVRSIYGPSYVSAQPAAGNGATLLAYEFVAAATSEDVRLTPYTASGGATFAILGLSIRNVPTQRFPFFQDVAASDLANWAYDNAAPLNGATLALSSSSSALPSGATLANVYGEFRSSGSGVTATWLAGAAGIKRTVTGLIVGQRYRASMHVLAQQLTFTNGSITASAPKRVVLTTPGAAYSSTASTAGWVTVEFTAVATSQVIRATVDETFTASGGSASTRQVVTITERGLYVEDRYATIADAYTLRSLTRSDSNGTRPVRLFEGQGLSDGVLVTVDPEPALVGLVTYTAVVRDTVGNVDVTVHASASLDGLVRRSRIAPASLPARGEWYELTPGLTLGRESTTTVAQVINRSDPLVTLGAQTLRSGTLRVFATDYAMGAALEAVFNTGEIVFLRQPDHAGLDMYVVGTRTSLELQPELTSPRRWILSVDYIEVAPPTTALRGSLGWTFAASTARNATFDASRQEFPTFLALLIGPEA